LRFNSAKVLFRVSPYALTPLLFLAALSMSELVRRRYFGRPIIANADAVMLKELRRMGGLLKHIHNESDGAYSKDTAGALVALKAYIERLSRDRQKG
jgi:hypothetical protein